MGIKIKKRRKNRRSRSRQEKNPPIGRVGEGPFAAMTFNRQDGSVVVHAFTTKDQANAQHALNVAQDRPLVAEDEVA